MDMSIDSTLIKKLRSQESWSQEILAERAGLSLRTIQRVERDGIAAPQTRLALAKAFDISPATLQNSEIDISTGKGGQHSPLLARVGLSLDSIISYFVTNPLRFGALAILSCVIATTVWVAFVVLIEGIFFISHADADIGYWQNLGNAIIGASFFALPLLLFYWMFEKIRQIGPN